MELRCHDFAWSSLQESVSFSDAPTRPRRTLFQISAWFLPRSATPTWQLERSMLAHLAPCRSRPVLYFAAEAKSPNSPLDDYR